MKHIDFTKWEDDEILNSSHSNRPTIQELRNAADNTGTKYETIRSRINTLHWPIKKALTHKKIVTGKSTLYEDEDIIKAAEHLRCNTKVIIRRIRLGWGRNKALTTPYNCKESYSDYEPFVGTFMAWPVKKRKRQNK